MVEREGQQNQLNRSMKRRHLFMLSLGGVIGTGLFLNAGYTINQAGAGGALIGYLFGGIILYLVMVCLGELAVHMPVTGSFQTYASKFISPSAGFSLGWMYFVGSATTAGVEFTAAGILMQRWFPDVSVWIWCAVFIALLFVLNALTTRGFAEAEYWFAGIKVVAVIFFIIIGFAAIFGIIPLEDRPAPFLENLAPSGLFPAGIAHPFCYDDECYLFLSRIGIDWNCCWGKRRAGEEYSHEPFETSFLELSSFILLLLLYYPPFFHLRNLDYWKVHLSPLMDLAGIPFAPDIMNFVILTAILSVGNSCIYASTRLLWAMANEGMAPKRVWKAIKTQGSICCSSVYDGFFSFIIANKCHCSRHSVCIVYVDCRNFCYDFVDRHCPFTVVVSAEIPARWRKIRGVCNIKFHFIH